MTGPRILSNLAADLRALSEAWHRTFGKVKCHLVDCHVCAATDWPVAPWVVRDPEPRDPAADPPAR